MNWIALLTRKRYSPGVLFIASVAFCVFFALIFGGARAHANVSLHPEPGSELPSGLRAYLENCDSYGASPGFVQWVGLRSAPEVSSIVITPGTQQVQLSYLMAGVICSNRNAVNWSSTTITSLTATQGTVTIEGGNSGVVPFSPINDVGLYRRAKIDINFDNGTPIYSSVNITISLTTTIQNHFANGTTGCVGPCSSTFNFTITLDVAEKAPLGHFDGASCNTWDGWALDQDWPSGSIPIRAYVDGPAGTGTMLPNYTTNLYRGDVNTTFGVTGNHGFSMPTPDAYKYSDHTVYMYAIGANSSGALDDFNAFIGSLSYSGCSRPGPNVSCVIDGGPAGAGANITVDLGASFWPNAVVTHNGPAGTPNINPLVVDFSVGGAAVGSYTGFINNGASRRFWQGPYVAGSGGSFAISVHVTGTGVDTTCTGTLTVNVPPPICPQQAGYFTVGGRKTLTASQNIHSYSNTPGWDFFSPIPPPLTFTGYSIDNTSSGPELLRNVSARDGTSGDYLPTPAVNGLNITSDFSNIVNNYPYDSHLVTTSYEFRVKRTTYTRNGGYVTLHRYTKPGEPDKYLEVGTVLAGWTDRGFYGNWTTYSESVSWVYDSGTTEYPLLGDCEYRQFDLTPTIPAPPILDNVESPSSVSGTANIAVRLSLPSAKRIFQGMAVNGIAVNITFVVVKQDGTTSVLRSDTSLHNFGTSGNTTLFMYNQAISSSASATRPPLAPGDKICMYASTNPSVGTMNSAGVIISRSVNTRYAPAGDANLCDQCDPIASCSTFIVDETYLKIYGADIRAGGGFGSGTCNSSTGGVFGFGYRPGTPATSTDYRGTSSQLGIMSLLNVNGVYSAAQRTASPTVPRGLTFSSTGGDSTYGGDFDGTASGGGICIPDYFNNTRSGSVGKVGTVNAAIAASPEGKSQYTANTLGGSGDITVPLRHQVAVYIDGNLVIDRNITLATGAGQPSDLPFFALIVRGNIYIAPNVSRLDGLYIAQPNNGQQATQGRIYTCSNGATPYVAANIATACDDNQLVINGALVAQQVKFLRTLRSLRDTPSTSEAPNFANGTGTNAAEVINYTPEMYIAPSPLLDPVTSAAGTGVNRYDAIYSLPPVN